VRLELKNVAQFMGYKITNNRRSFKNMKHFKQFLKSESIQQSNKNIYKVLDIQNTICCKYYYKYYLI